MIKPQMSFNGKIFLKIASLNQLLVGFQINQLNLDNIKVFFKTLNNIRSTMKTYLKNNDILHKKPKDQGSDSLTITNPNSMKTHKYQNPFEFKNQDFNLNLNLKLKKPQKAENQKKLNFFSFLAIELQPSKIQKSSDNFSCQLTLLEHRSLSKDSNHTSKNPPFPCVSLEKYSSHKSREFIPNNSSNHLNLHKAQNKKNCQKFNQNLEKAENSSFLEKSYRITKTGTRKSKSPLQPNSYSKSQIKEKELNSPSSKTLKDHMFIQEPLTKLKISINKENTEYEKIEKITKYKGKFEIPEQIHKNYENPEISLHHKKNQYHKNTQAFQCSDDLSPILQKNNECLNLQKSRNIAKTAKNLDFSKKSSNIKLAASNKSINAQKTLTKPIQNFLKDEKNLENQSQNLLLDKFFKNTENSSKMNKRDKKSNSYENLNKIPNNLKCIKTIQKAHQKCDETSIHYVKNNDILEKNTLHNNEDFEDLNENHKENDKNNVEINRKINIQTFDITWKCFVCLEFFKTIEEMENHTKDQMNYPIWKKLD